MYNKSIMSFYSFALLIALSISSTSVAALDLEGPQVCSSKYCHGNIVAPLSRVAVVELAMYTGLVAIWPDFYAPSHGSTKQFKKAWTMPPYFDSTKPIFLSDGDIWPINAVLHPIYGSEIYLVSRTWEHNPFMSFMFSASASVVWEYLVESWFQRPSLIDLLWTPLAGAALGEFRYFILKAASQKIDKKVPKVIIMTLIDPLGQIERAIMGNCTPSF